MRPPSVNGLGSAIEVCWKRVNGFARLQNPNPRLRGRIQIISSSRFPNWRRRNSSSNMRHSRSGFHRLEKHQFLQPLFTPDAQVGEFHHALALWLTDHFLARHAQELVCGNPKERWETAPPTPDWFVWRRLSARDTDPDIGPVFSQWVGVLLSQPRDILPCERWGQLLAHCHFPEDKIVSVLLFEFLTRPRVLLEESWVELNLWRGLEHWLSEAWKKLFRPNLPAYANALRTNCPTPPDGRSWANADLRRSRRQL